LTLEALKCHKAPTGCALNPFRSADGVQRTVAKFGVCSNAGVAFLVIESREVMNVRQASQYLGISPDTLYRYITEGEIPAFKLGNRWKLRKTILDRWMERKMSQTTGKRR
jgi:excisionase family DNA binding protein